MKTLLALLITFSFALGTQAYAQSDEALSEKIYSYMEDADQLDKVSELGFKKLIVINALESLANSNIDDPKLIKIVTDKVITLEQALTLSQQRLVKNSLEKLQNR